MRELTAVVARELQEWRRIFVAALAAGCLVLLAPLIPGTRGHGPLEALDAMSAFMSTAFGLGVALLAGAGLIGRELAERRMGFYFFRPLRDGAIWGGKMVAAVFLAFFSALLVLVPPTLVGHGLLGLRHEGPQRAIALLAALVIALVILGNSIHLTFKSRSKWALLDLLALLAIAALLSLTLYPLIQAQALGLSRSLITAFILLFLLTLAAAGYVGIRRGRTDLRQVHKYHALAVWPVLGVATMIMVVLSMWVRSAGPEDFDKHYVAAAAPTGSWLAVTGSSTIRADFQTTLLMNVETGERLRLPGGPVIADTVDISQDGRRAIWLEPIGVDPSRGRLMVASLEGKPVKQPTTIFAAPRDGKTLSADGSQLALLSGGIVTVLDIESERALASARIPSERSYSRRMFFAGPNLIRLYDRATTTTMKIYEFDIQNKKLEETGSIDVGEQFHYSVTAAGTLAVRLPLSGDLQLRDARTGRILAVLVRGKNRQGRQGFLADGRVVVAEVIDGRAQLAIFSPAGVLERTIELGPGATVRLGGQPGLGSLVVATSPEDRLLDRKTLTVFLVDLESGTIRPVASQLSPLTYLWWYMGHLPVPGSVATRLFITVDDQLLYLNPATGERRVIAGPAAEL
jgi:hypothetical protein